MTQNPPTIEITRNASSVSIKAIMPIWNKKHTDGKIEILIPLLGDEVVTCAMNDEDAEIAIIETFKAFCIVSERHGMGIENELEYIGWERESSSIKDHCVLTVPSPKPIMDRIMDTGDTRLLSVAIC